MRSLQLVVVASAIAILSISTAEAQQAQAPVAIPAPQYRITNAYAKRLVRERATQLQGSHGKGWSVSFSVPNAPIGSTTLAFKAKVNWGGGIHIMSQGQGAQVSPQLFIPEINGLIDMSKGPGSPKGQNRLTILSPLPAAQ